MLDLCRKMRKLGLQHMCDIKGTASIKADSEAPSGGAHGAHGAHGAELASRSMSMGPIDGPIIVVASGNRTFLMSYV